MHFRLSDDRPRTLLVPCRMDVFAVREVPRRRGKPKLQACGWHGWNPDPIMEQRSARLRGSGSFYWPNAIRLLTAARQTMRDDTRVTQIKLETIGGEEIGRLYR